MSEVTKAVATGAHRTDKAASSNVDPHAGDHVPMSTYWAIFGALMLLLVITVVAAFIPLGPLNMPVAMLIASIKAVLVILYFMHVKFASKLTKVFVAASFFWLIILFAMTFMDYISRDWLSNSRGWSDNPVKSAYDEGSKPYHQGHGDKSHGETVHDKNPGDKHVGDAPAGTTHDPKVPANAEGGPGHPGSG